LFFKFSNGQNENQAQKASRNLRRFTKKIWGKRGKRCLYACVCVSQSDLTESSEPDFNELFN